MERCRAATGWSGRAARGSVGLLFVGLLVAGLVAAPPPKAPNRLLRVPLWFSSPGSSQGGSGGGSGSASGGSFQGDSGGGGDPLAAKDLTATVDGRSARVVAMQGQGNDLMVLLVLDLTGDLSRVEPAKDALKSEISKLPSSTYVGLLRAQDGSSVLADPTSDRTVVNREIENLPVSGKAGLLDTVETIEGIGDAILAKSAVRVAVFYLTDSEIRNYREDFTNPVINSSDAHDLSRRFPEVLIQEKISKLSARLLGQQSPLFIVHLQYRSERLDEAYQNGLKQLADVTGGASIFCQSSAEIPEAIHQIFEIISSCSSVTVALPEHTGRTVQVQLQASDNRTLSYRTRFTVTGK